MKEFAILGLFYFSVSILYGQNIEIGQDANEIADIIESSTYVHNKVQHSDTNTTYWNWDYILYRDKISDVVQCYGNEYVSGLGTISYYCTHYIFSDERLAYISTRFTNIDSVTINTYLQDNFGKYKIGQFYFSDDYNYYSVIRVTPKGFVAVDWQKAEWDSLSPEIQDSINNRLEKESEMKRLNLIVEDTVRQRENEIKSKFYDLQVHDSTAFNLFIQDLRLSLIEGLKNNSKFPGWEEIEIESEKCFVFKNTYKALYRILDQSKLRTDSRYLFIPDDGVFADYSYFELVQGNDTACDFIEYYSPFLPSIKKEGYNVMTDARVTGIDVSYMKGITHVKIKDGAVKYRKYLPPPEIQKLATDSLKKLQNGLYEVKYEAGLVMDSTFINTEQEKLPTVGKTILTATVVAILCVFYYLSDSEE